ncbi:MAG: tetratricopeptide repeat protein [Candidatus Rokubacteria bacterium]|nr:tetratricopeptide repeat protein [Candidatus Rokubacteria bacterium]
MTGRAPAVAALAAGAVILAAAAALAQGPAAPMTREQALGALAAADRDQRRDAAARLGELATMADVPALVRALRDPDPVVRALADQSTWQVWSRSGDPAVDALFQVGVEQMRQRALAEAIATFSQVIARKPEFAEGWNKRATVYFLAGDLDRSLRDCDEVLRRNPSHWGVLAGFGQIHRERGDPVRALDYFERALAINPNLEQVALAIEELRALLARPRRDTT